MTAHVSPIQDHLVALQSPLGRCISISIRNMCKVFYSLKYLRTWELRLSPLIGSFYHFSPLLTWLFLNLLYIQVCLFLSALHTNTRGTFLSDLSRCHSADKYLSLASDHLQSSKSVYGRWDLSQSREQRVVPWLSNNTMNAPTSTTRIRGWPWQN